GVGAGWPRAAGCDGRGPGGRGRLERELRRVAGGPVTLAGPVRRRVSTRPVLLVEDVRIGVPSGEDGDVDRTAPGAADVGRIARLELEAGLFESVWARWPHVHRFEIEGLRWSPGAHEGPAVEILVDRAEGRAPVGAPLELRASGTMAGLEVQADLQGG